MHFARVYCFAALAVVLASSRGVRADSARAEALFERGVSAMLAGDYATGCPLVAESLGLEPLPGTLFTLAECELRWGKLASAATHYSDYLRLFEEMDGRARAGQKGRDGIARRALDEIRSQIPKLRVRVAPGTASRARVFVDDVELVRDGLGQSIPMDPGEHRVRLSLDGNKSERTLALARGEEREVVLSLPPGKRARRVVVRAPAPTARRDEGSRLGAPTWVALGVGALGIGVGAVAGGLALDRKRVVDDNCQELACNSKGHAALEDGRRYARVSTVGFVAGGVALGVAAVLYSFDRDAKRPKQVGLRW